MALVLLERERVEGEMWGPKFFSQSAGQTESGARFFSPHCRPQALLQFILNYGTLSPPYRTYYRYHRPFYDNDYQLFGVAVTRVMKVY